MSKARKEGAIELISPPRPRRRPRSLLFTRFLKSAKLFLHERRQNFSAAPMGRRAGQAASGFRGLSIKPERGGNSGRSANATASVGSGAARHAGQLGRWSAVGQAVTSGPGRFYRRVRARDAPDNNAATLGRRQIRSCRRGAASLTLPARLGLGFRARRQFELQTRASLQA